MKTRQAKEAAEASAPKKTAPAPKPAKPVQTKKLTYGEEIELKALPDKIEELEAARETLHQKMCEPGFFEGPQDAIQQATAELESLDADIASAYERWEELEGKG